MINIIDLEPNPIIYRLPPLPPTSGPEAWMPGCLGARMPGCLDAGVSVACQMSHLGLPCGWEHQFEGQGEGGGAGGPRAEIPCGPLLGPAVTPLR